MATSPWKIISSHLCWCLNHPTIFALWEGTWACAMAADPASGMGILGPRTELLSGSGQLPQQAGMETLVTEQQLLSWHRLKAPQGPE